jgi:peptidoglycan/LPS O-acetylase OafA/YrhL
VLAALHIYFFHLKQAHDAGLLTFSFIAGLPAPLARLIGRGYVSTGFFFQLSGFLLAYAYLDMAGRPKTSDAAFWKGRFLRLYPLYLVSLLLLLPAPALLPFMAKNPTPIQAAVGVSTSLTLTQSWVPGFAIWWNAPAWALSAFAAFYAIFPWFCRRISRLGPRGLLWLIAALTLLSGLPAGAYILLDPAGDAWTASSVTLGGLWLAALRFHPLSWVFQFLAGVALGRLFGLIGARSVLRRPAQSWLSPGDLLGMALIAFLALVPDIPYVILRHGLLAPFTLVLIAALAHGHGLLASVLGLRPLTRLSEASFSLFALQMPAGLWFCVATLRTSAGTSAHLVGMIVWTLGLAFAWAEWVQRPLLERLRGGPSRHVGGEFRGERDRRPLRSPVPLPIVPEPGGNTSL